MSVSLPISKRSKKILSQKEEYYHNNIPYEDREESIPTFQDFKQMEKEIQKKKLEQFLAKQNQHETQTRNLVLTEACCKCGKANSITPAGYFCVDCTAKMGIGTQRDNYIHGVV